MVKIFGLGHCSVISANASIDSGTTRNKHRIQKAQWIPALVPGATLSLSKHSPEDGDGFVTNARFFRSKRKR